MIRVWAGWLLLAGCVAGAEVDFERDVRPLLRKNCTACHNGEQRMSGLRLDRKSAALIGGSSGPAIVLGSSAESKLYLRITGATQGQRMPPTGPLSDAEITTLRNWIDQGAHWPDDPAPAASLQADAEAAPLFASIRAGDFAAVRNAVRRNPKLARARGPGGATILMQTALYGDAASVAWLLAQGADPNAANAAAATPLMWATADVKKVRALLDAGANVNARSEDGGTALVIALRHAASGAAARLMVERGADLKTPAGEPDVATLAARWGDLPTLRLLLDRGVKPGGGALTGAALAECAECVKLLLERGADKGATTGALRAAALRGSMPFVRQLLESGADVNAADARGWTALHSAAHSEIEDGRVRLILDRGGDRGLRNKKGETPLDLARRKGGCEAARLLGASEGGPQTAGSEPAALPAARAAVEKSLPLLQGSGPRFFQKGGCVACHHHSLPAMAAQFSRERGIPVDERIAGDVARQTLDYIEARRERVLQGIAIPGAEDTISYILFGLAVEGRPATPATDALARYMRLRQNPDGSWPIRSSRPPLEVSRFTTTAVSIRALRVYAPPALQADYERGIASAVKWLGQAHGANTEERAFRVLGLKWGGAPDAAVRQASKDLAATQNRDGGWSQLPSLPSDAYATGQALVGLLESGAAASVPVCRHATEFLLKTQRPDGSWFVKSRSEPFQPYFESGFPYGHDQWISAAASSWATAALALTVDKPGRAR